MESTKFLGKTGRKLFGFENLMNDTKKSTTNANDMVDDDTQSIPDDISIGSSSSSVISNKDSKMKKAPVTVHPKKIRFSPQKLISPVKSIKNFIAKRSNSTKQMDSNMTIDNNPESPISPDRMVSGKFRLRGKNLSYYSKNEGTVITLDITESKVRLGSSDVLGDGKMKFTYFITTKEKEHCFTSSSEKARLTSMIILHEQVQAWKSIAKVLDQNDEICVGFGVVNRRRSAMMMTSASFTTVTMALTSRRRVLFFQQMSTSLQEQVTWTSAHPPTFIKVIVAELCIYNQLLT